MKSSHHGFEHVFAATLGRRVQHRLALICSKDKVSSLVMKSSLTGISMQSEDRGSAPGARWK